VATEGYRLGNLNGTDSRYSWLGDVTAKVGYPVSNLLPYVTGGVAFSDIQHVFVNHAADIGETLSKTRTGWTAGAGLEYAYTKQWSGDVEYRYTSFGNYDQASTEAFPGFTYNQHPTVNTIMLGVSYHLPVSLR
jgi:outer membrane immunogenic protein